MFEGLLFLVIDGDNGVDSVGIERILNQSNDVQIFFKSKHAPDCNFFEQVSPNIATSITHVIANNQQVFEEYETAIQSMIPTVNPQWIWDSIKQSRILNCKPYSTVKNHFLKDVYLCVADSLELEKKFMYSTTRAFGGEYLDSLTRYTTHLIAEDMYNDKLLIAASAITNVKIVEPRWLKESIVAIAKLGESKFLLDNESDSERDQISLENSNINGGLFKDLQFLIAEDCNFSEYSLGIVTTLIELHGGKVVKNTNSKVDVCIAQFRDETHQDLNTVVFGTLSWLYYVIVLDKWVNPLSLNILHYPVPRTGLPGFGNLKVSITNYSGDSRHYLSKLIEIMGGTFTKILTKENDFLIAATPLGKKYDAVMHKWDSDVKIVNHLWLEDCFASWKLTDWRDSRYNVGDQQQLIGTTSIKSESLTDGKKDKRDVVSDSMSESEASEVPKKKQKVEKRQKPEKKQNIEKKPEKKQNIEKKPANTGKNVKEEGEKEGKVEDDEDENDHDDDLPKFEDTVDVNGRSKRSAARKAAEKLHTDMNDLNTYQEMTKSARKEIEFMNQLEEIHTSSKKPSKSDLEVNSEIDGKNIQNKNNNNNNNKPRQYAILTGCELEITLSKADIDHLKTIGIKILHDYSQTLLADIIVAPRILRTEKFLKCFGQAKYIVHPSYIVALLESLKKGILKEEVNIEDYWLHKVIDSKAVSEALGVPNLSLPDILKLPNRGQVFSGVPINLSSKLDGGIEVISRILKSHRAPDTKEVKTVTSGNAGSLLCTEEEVLLIAHASKDTKLVSAFKKQCKNGVALKWEWCVKSIFSLQLQDYKQYQL